MKITNVLKEIKNKYLKRNILGYLYNNLESGALFNFENLVENSAFFVDEERSADCYLTNLLTKDGKLVIFNHMYLDYSQNYDIKIVETDISEKPLTIYFIVIASITNYDFGTMHHNLKLVQSRAFNTYRMLYNEIESQTLYKVVTNPNYNNGDAGTLTNVFTGETTKLIPGETVYAAGY